MDTFSEDELKEALLKVGERIMRAAEKHGDKIADDRELMDQLNAILHFYTGPPTIYGLAAHQREAMTHFLTTMVGLISLGMELEGKPTTVVQWAVAPDVAEVEDKTRKYIDASPEARQWILQSLGPEAQVVLTTMMEVYDENEPRSS